MIRLGIVDFDTSHVVAFTQRLNHVEASEDQWVEGAQVVMGCPGTSLMSPERIPGFTEKLKSYGVPLVDDPTEMIGQIDGVLIESVDGSVHYERAKPLLEAGVPMFIDKPFTCSLEHAKAIAELYALHPNLRIVFCANRKVANEWTRHFFGAIWSLRQGNDLK